VIVAFGIMGSQLDTTFYQYVKTFGLNFSLIPILASS
jgi:hypothetical protein